MARFSSELDATELAARIRSGETTAIRAMEASLEAIAEKRDLGAVTFHDEDLGRSQANALQVEPASAGVAARYFHGVPFLMKDLGATTAGLPTRAGSKSLAKRFGRAPADSLLTKRFRAAGLLPFGTTTVSEFGMALSSEPAVGPIARNPADLSRTPGGSSGGAAAAVTVGIVAIAHATDAAGSTRVPASCCGLVGLKTTRGAVPEGPDFSNHLGGLVSEFVVSRSLRDAAAALRLVTGDAEGPGPDPVIQGLSADLATPVAPLRIGVVEDGGDGPKVDADRTAGIRHAAKILAEAGHQTVSLDPSLLVQLSEQSQAVVIDLVCANLARGLSQLQPAVSHDEIEPLCFASYERGRAMSAVRLCESELSMARIAHRLWRLFDDFDVILLPMLATAPPRIGHFPLDHADIDGHWQRMNAFAPFAMLANVGGIPALSVPHGVDGAGLSIPVQLIGPMGADMLLLRAARVLEQALPWNFAYPVAGLHSL